MRRSQKNLFWKYHKIIELKKENKTVGWFGIRLPPTKKETMKK